MTQKQHYSTEPEHFILSPETEPLLERVLFNNRSLVLMVLGVLTLVFAFGLTQIRLDSSIEKYIPLNHPYIQNYLVHKDDMKSGMANIKIAVAAVEGDIFDDDYLKTLSKINDDVSIVLVCNRYGRRIPAGPK